LLTAYVATYLEERQEKIGQTIAMFARLEVLEKK